MLINLSFNDFVQEDIFRIYDETDELEQMMSRDTFTVNNNNSNITLPTVTSRQITSTIMSNEISSLLRGNNHIQIESFDEGIQSGSIDFPVIAEPNTTMHQDVNTNQPSHSDSKYRLSDLHEMAPKRKKVFYLFPKHNFVM